MDNHEITYDNGSVDITQLERKIVHANDLAYICHDIYNKLNNKLVRMQLLDDKRSRIQNTGRLVWIVDRFVDIDFSTLKDAIPYVKDGDHLMVIQDETREGQCSIYSIYNTESVPNVRYLGYGEPNLYPSTSAVEQYVANAVAMSEYNMMEIINDNKTEMMKSIDSLIAENVDLREKITTLTEQLNHLTTVVNQMWEEYTSNKQSVADSISTISEKVDANTASISTIETNLTAESNRAMQIETSIVESVEEEVARATKAEADINDMLVDHDGRLKTCEAEIEALKEKP